MFNFNKLEGFNVESRFCCGNKFEEYCCTQSELEYEDKNYLEPAYEVYEEQNESSSTGTWIGFSFIPLIGVIIGVILLIKKYKEEFREFIGH